MLFTLSPARLYAILVKEFNQLKRDHTTFVIIIAIPLIQLILFGYAINADPKRLPTALIASDYSQFTRTFIDALKNTDYFDFVQTLTNEKQGDKLLASGKVKFVLNIPSDFSRKLVKGEKPQVLLEADATDPTSTRNAVAAANFLQQTVFNDTGVGALNYLKTPNPPFTVNMHLRYNPSGITQYNIVPGLMGIILTMTLVLVTAMAITRERERGTMENLLTMPASPLEVIVGKTLPYIMIGYIQVTLVLFMAYQLFDVPIKGSLLLLLAVSLPFIFSNLFMGIAFSTLAETQLQASQFSMFFFLPSILLSGFAFPFQGMPKWAQFIGNILPLTHFVNITRGIMLKGNGINEIWPDVWPIILFMVIAMVVGVLRYQRTLD